MRKQRLGAQKRRLHHSTNEERTEDLSPCRSQRKNSVFARIEWAVILINKPDKTATSGNRDNDDADDVLRAHNVSCWTL